MAARVPAVRFASRVQIASTFFPRCPCRPGGRRAGGHAAAGTPPPPLTADIRVVIRRHFPVPAIVGACPCGTRTRTVRVHQKVVVAEDIALRRRAARHLRTPELVERALAEDVLPLVGDPLDRAAVVVVSGQICAHVSAACASSRVALSGVRVLVLIDALQKCPVVVPVVFRGALPPPPPPRPWCKPMWRSGAVNSKNVIVMRTDEDQCMDSESELPATTKWPLQPVVGVVGDTLVVKRVQLEEPCVDRRFEGWLPW